MKQANFYRIVILVLAILCLYQWQCRGGNECSEPSTVTIRDTTYITVKDTGEVITPVAKTTTKPKMNEPFLIVAENGFPDTVFVPSWIDPTIDTAAIIAAYIKTVQDWATTRTYKETTQTQFGTVTVLDTVQYNKLRSQRVLTDFKIPLVKETKTLKERGKVFAGLGGIGSKEDLLQGAGGSLLYLKNSRGVNAGVFFTPNGELYHLSFKQLISFRKK